MARALEVQITGDSRKLERAFARSERAAGKFNRSMTRMGRARGGVNSLLGARVGAAGGAFAGVGVVAGIRDAVNAASDFNEQVSKSEVVFGSSAQEIKDWSKTTTKAFGISQRQALATASSFGALFAPLGIAGDAAAKQSQRLTELGADLASFYNTDVQDALDAIRSGIVGESEPLRRYGVLLSETRVQQQAMADTGKKHAASLTTQEKALARVEIILKDTQQAQGDFARTSKGLANQTRTLTAEWDDFKVEMGQSVIPVVTDAIDVFGKFFEFLNKHDWLKQPGWKVALGVLNQAREKIGVGEDTWLAHQFPEKGPQLINQYNAALKEHLAIRKRQMDALPRTQGTAPARARPGFTVEQRNQWFDARIARQLDRVQDLSLRRQLARLKEIAQAVRSRLQATKDITRQLTLRDKLVEIARQELDVQEQITASIQAGNQALKDRADAIKSAVIEKLQQRQTDILNKRALQDAREQLRIAKQEGGRFGIREARRGLQDVRMDILRARVERAPATLTAGGRFALAGVVININGVTDPAEVARRVSVILKRRSKHTTTKKRGP